jgi:signal transduction histidine kinase
MTDENDRQSDLFRAFPDPLLCYEGDSDEAVVRAVNPAFKRTFDVDEATVTGDPLADHLLVDAIEVDSGLGFGDGVRASSEDAGGAGVEADGEAVLSRLDGNERAVIATRRDGDDEVRHFRLRAVPTPDGGAENCILYTEVTDLERRRRNLESRAERLEGFIRVAAHDLRNPLDVAKIRLEAARDAGEAVHFEKAETALERIEHIIRDVLSVGGAEVEPSEGVAIGEVAEAAWSTVDTAAGGLVIKDDLSPIEADADRLQQLFENLFRNAVEHGGRDVTVTVGSLYDGSGSDASGRSTAPSVNVPSDRSEDEVRQEKKRTAGGFFVADDGPGVTGEERDRAFEPGYSTADDNTGLGLAIVQQIAENHGWHVTLTSGASGGARFEFVGVETDGRS